MLLLLFILIAIYLLLYFIGLPYEMAPMTFYVVNSLIYGLLSFTYLSKYRRDNIMCFEMLFGISFWLCCFFAVFVLSDINAFIISDQLISFSETMMCRSCILCMIGYMFYLLGLCWKRTNNISNTDLFIRQNPAANTALNYLTTFFIVLFFLRGGYNFLNSYDATIVMQYSNDDRFGNFGEAMVFAITMLNITTISNICTIDKRNNMNSRQFLKHINKHYWVNVLAMSLFLMVCGYRSGAMQIILPILVLLSMKKIIRTRQTVLIIILGFFAMVLLGLFRSRSMSAKEISEEISIVMFFRDFLGANSATPSLVEYVDIHGHAHFRNAICSILSVIPFLQSLIIGVLGNDWIAISSSTLYTKEISQSFDSGLGTNLIGDLYYTGGFACVIVLMFLLGFIVKKMSNSTNKYVLVAMACFVGNAVFMPRAEFFYVAHSCGLAIIIYFFTNHLFPIKNSRKIYSK